MDSTEELIQSELRQLKNRPTSVAWRDVKVGEDWDGDPAIFVRAVLKEDDADDDKAFALREITRKFILEVTRRESSIEWWPHVRFYEESEYREALAKFDSGVLK